MSVESAESFRQSDKLFQIPGPEIAKARCPSVDSLAGAWRYDELSAGGKSKTVTG